mgnify:CR=1 FL=1
MVGFDVGCGERVVGPMVDGGCDFVGPLVGSEGEGSLVVPFDVGPTVGLVVCIDGNFVGCGDIELGVGSIDVVAVGSTDAIGN